MTSLTSRAVAVVSGLLAVWLLILAVPRTLAALSLLPSEGAVSRLQGLRPVSTENLLRLIRNQRRALVWQTSGRTWTDLGLAQLLIAERLPRHDPQVEQRLEAAKSALTEGLILAPANPFAWTRLAYAEALVTGWSPLANAALRLAFITGRYEPRLLWSRLRLSFSALPNLGPEDQDLVFQQIRIAASVDPEALAALAVDLGKADVIRRALSGDPDTLERFDALVDKQRPGRS